MEKATLTTGHVIKEVKVTTWQVEPRSPAMAQAVSPWLLLMMASL
jgi:hypothetical protein